MAGSAYRNMINFQSLLSLLPSLGPSVMKDLVAAAPELFHDSKIERAKVLRQCLEYQEAETTNLDKKKLVLDDTNKIISSWLRFTKSLEDERREARSCAYPRCSGLSLPDLTTRYTSIGSLQHRNRTNWHVANLIVKWGI
ncbi:hypothetical protein FRC09_015194 [Ceratobasidium sp. 395]|nr:hypothetical protein FRC09_015194 [Ceratobasidium sp. 395]